MTAVRKDLAIEQGAGWRWVITVNAGGEPADLTGYAARLQMRETVDAAEPFVSLTDGDGITVDEEAGTLDVYLSDDDTAALTVRRGVYDLEIEPAGGDTVRLYAGKVRISPEVTR